MGNHLDRAIADTQRQLCHLGLSNLVHWVTVEYSLNPFDHFDFALGWYIPDRRSVLIPRYGVWLTNNWSLLKTRLGYQSASMQSMRDVIRHEYGHALRDMLGRFGKRSRIWGRSPCVSDYAEQQSTAEGRADEDFAETFMYFLKWKGRFRHSHDHPLILAKWDAMLDSVSAAQRRRPEVLQSCSTCPCIISVT